LFGYLYHPYLEGMTIAPWIYGAFLGLGLGIAERAALGQHGRLGALTARPLFGHALATEVKPC
jgi:hypothetical protein